MDQGPHHRVQGADDGQDDGQEVQAHGEDQVALDGGHHPPGQGQQVGQLPTQEQMAALARDVAEIQTLLQQAGRKREISVSPPSLRTALSVLVWLALLLLGTMVGMVLLQTIWSGLAALWSVVKLLIPWGTPPPCASTQTRKRSEKSGR